jgi:monoamine oxidase
LNWNTYAKEERPKGPVAIIGGGVAGLTAAYRLQAAGAAPIVFEASNRWGGRMFTHYDFYKGMFCELGGEFVDTNHEDLQKLASELGVELQTLAAEGDGEDLYFFGGAFHTPKEMLDPEKQTGAQPFQMFGESDEVFRIKGGSSALINALVAALENKIEMKKGYTLTALDTKDGKIVAGFNAPGGASSESFDTMVLALPFTKLRQVEGLERLELGDEKLKCIRELGYGQSAKIMQGTASRVWRSPAARLAGPSNGIFYSDLGFQYLWDSSRGQPGEAGIITNFLGVKPGLGDAKSALDAFHADLPKMSPKMAESLDPSAVVSWFWSVYPYTLGSYASAKPGQYTTFLEVAPEPGLDGRLQFAGEHTSADFLGFMNGGVESGNRAATALIETMALEKD